MEAKKITSLIELKQSEPSTTWIQVKHDGAVFEIEIERIPYSEWMSLDHSTPYPQRVQSGMGSSGPTYDYNHPDYQKGLRERTVKVGMRRLARCLKAEMEGNTVDEKADWLFQNFDIGLLSAIAGVMNELHTEGEATILDRRDSFHTNGNTPPAGNGTATPDA